MQGRKTEFWGVAKLKNGRNLHKINRGSKMPRPKKDDEHKKIPVKFYVLPSYIPIIKNVIKNLDDNNAIDFISAVPEKNEKTEEISTVIEIDKPIKKASFGIDANEWIREHSDKVIDVAQKESQQKDYYEWQNDAKMIEVDNAIRWTLTGWGSEGSQLRPDEGYEILESHRSLATRLCEALKNGKGALYNELMTELYERLKNE